MGPLKISLNLQRSVTKVQTCLFPSVVVMEENPGDAVLTLSVTPACHPSGTED